MIKQLKNFPKSFLNYDVFSLKIECDFKAYNGYNFAQFFKVLKGNKITAVISFIDSFMCISANETDITQLRQFINMLSPKGVLCNKTLAQGLGLNGKDVFIMQRTNKAKIINGYETEVTASEVYDKLFNFAANELDLPERDVFVSDFSFKQRRSLATAVSNQFSIASAFSVGEFAAYIGAVATKPSNRNDGCGTAATEALIQHLNKNKVYLFCNEELIEFYKKLQFKNIGQATIFSIGERQ